MANIRHDRSYASPSNASRLTHIPNRRDRSASEFGTVASRTPLLRQPIIPGNATNDVAVTTEVPSRYSWKYFKYPDEVFVPTFNRRQVTMIGISNAIGTGLFLSSGQALENAGPLGILLGYAGMSFLMYCIVVSYAEMASVYPNCQGTIALANRFVDPALGFAMGWNAWAFWGLTIASQTAAAISLIRYWRPPVSLEPLWPSIAIVFSIAVVFSSRWYGNLETGFAMIKVFGVLLLRFAALSFMCMAPKHGGGELKDEVIFKQLTSMNTSAYLQAIIGTLFTYIRFYHGTKHQENKYKDEIKRIKDNRARGQPYVAGNNGYFYLLIHPALSWLDILQDTSADPNAPVDYQTSTEANTFLVTYLPPPILLLLVFGYKLIKRSPMTSVEDMDFSDVEFVRGDPIEPKPQKGDLWGRAWWTLAK
ncbi:hypothetical protein FRB97_008455 [Tulasnella sp. 331]|nr:hypothetical protein FRB97_008455 [Tulasnella sp. 331]